MYYGNYNTVKLKNTVLKLRAWNYSENTIKTYVSVLVKMFECFKCDSIRINFNQLENYLNNIRSVAKYNQILSAYIVYNKINDKKKIPKSIKNRPRKEKMLPQIIDKKYLLNRINSITNTKHKTILSLAYSVGLRLSEIINLKIENIDSKRMTIFIKQSKGNKDRIVPLTNSMLKLLRIYYIEYKPDIYLFNGQYNLKYSSTSCNQLMKKYFGKQYHFHQLRHSCATHLTDQGIDIHIIQKLLGHSNVKTTEIYTQVSTKTLNNLPLGI